MTYLKKAFFVLGIMTILAFAVTINGSHVADPIPAHAVGCYAGGCEGLWPWNEGCQYDAYVVYDRYAYDFGVFLWYSRACDANWATLQYPTCSGVVHGVDVQSGDGSDYGTLAPACYGNGWAGTDMVNGSYLARACGEYDDQLPVCTNWG